MGKQVSVNFKEMQKENPEVDIDEVLKEGRQFKRVLALVSSKIYERFNTLLAAFRFFDTDHSLSLNLNEFAQGIEYLRIKISFDDVKNLYNFLDKDMNDTISYGEFKMLSEENWRRFDPIVRYFDIKKNRLRMSKIKMKGQGSSTRSALKTDKTKEASDTPEESYKLQRRSIRKLT